MKDTHNVKGAQALFAAAFTYALTGILVREVAPMWGDNAQVAARYSLVFIFLVIIGIYQKNTARVPKRKLPVALLLAITFALMVQLFTYGINKTTIANALFTFYASNMVMSFLLGTFVLHEKISGSKLMALLFAIIGLGVYAGDLRAGNIGLLFCIAAGVAAGFTNVCNKLLSGIDRTAVLKIQYGVGSVFTAVVMLLSGEQIIRNASVRGSLLMIFFSLVVLLGSNLVLYGYQHFDVNIATVILSTELVFAAIMAYFLFHETPALHELIGGLLIFIGSIVGSGALNRRIIKAAPNIPARN